MVQAQRTSLQSQERENGILVFVSMTRVFRFAVQQPKAPMQFSLIALSP